MNRLLGGKELKGHKRPGRKASLVLFALLAGAVSLLATSVQAIFTLSLDNSKPRHSHRVALLLLAGLVAGRWVKSTA